MERFLQGQGRRIHDAASETIIPCRTDRGTTQYTREAIIGVQSSQPEYHYTTERIKLSKYKKHYIPMMKARV
jgi:hypothetical protein